MFNFMNPSLTNHNPDVMAANRHHMETDTGRINRNSVYDHTPSPTEIDMNDFADEEGEGVDTMNFSLKSRGMQSHLPSATSKDDNIDIGMSLLEPEGLDDCSPLDLDDDFELDEEVELMLQHHDDPSMNVLYMETTTRRRALGPAGGGGGTGPSGGGDADTDMLLLEGLLDDDEDVQPIAPRRDSIESPTEDWDTMLGMEEEIRESQQEMASGFRFLIGIDKTGSPRVRGLGQGGTMGDIDGTSKTVGDDDTGFELFLSDDPDPTTIQSTHVPVSR